MHLRKKLIKAHILICLLWSIGIVGLVHILDVWVAVPALVLVVVSVCVIPLRHDNGITKYIAKYLYLTGGSMAKNFADYASFFVVTVML